jgi:hypothetical protein
MGTFGSSLLMLEKKKINVNIDKNVIVDLLSLITSWVIIRVYFDDDENYGRSICLDIIRVDV